MQKKMASILLIAMIMQWIVSGSLIDYSYANIDPSIDSIEVEQIVRVENDKKTYSYRVIFNGYNVRQIQAIRVRRKDAPNTVVRTIPSSQLTVVNDANIAAENITTLTSFFGNVLDEDIQLTLVYNGGETEVESSNVFMISSENLPDIDRIHNGNEWINPPSWPAYVIKETGSIFRLEGSNFDSLSGYTLWMQGAGAPSKLEKDTDYTISGDIVTIGAGGSRIPIGNDMRIIFEKGIGAVTMRYRLEKAVSIIKPLDLGDPEKIDISPLKGTQGTLIRIKAPNHQELTNSQTKIYIGGLEATRNIIEAEGRDGTFLYDGDKKGLEVIVPRMTAGPKQIVIQNYLGDTYVHNKLFQYYESNYPTLQVGDMAPNSGPVGRKNSIDFITINNAVAVHTLENINQEEEVTVRKGTKENLKYPSFQQEIEAAGNNQNVLYIQYDLGNGRYIERRISLTIGLPGEITEMTWLNNNDGNTRKLSDLPPSTDITAMTAAVGTPGQTVVRLRTETVLLRVNGNVVEEVEYVVEQAPYTAGETKYYTFTADQTTPVINNIIPKQGPYDKDIIITLEGQNFHVRNINGTIHYPTVVIGKNGQYKVINKEGMFYSTTADGNYDASNPANRFENPENYIPMTVLDQNNNIVDGQIRTTGTRIKLTLPGDSIRGYYTGAADVIVRNPTATGDLGATAIRQNFFEYLPKPSVEPYIDSVVPDKVGVGSQERVTVTGRNFQPNMIVTIDGEIVQNPTINVAAGTIQFNAPVGRAGKTFLQIINPATGGMASHDFEYIRTYSSPYIEKIIPNAGGKGSLVIIKGNNFYKTDHQGSTPEFKIGTSVLIDGKDVNKTYFPITEEPRNFTNPFDGQEIKDSNGNPIKTYSSNIAVVDNKTIYMIVPDPYDPDTSFFEGQPLDVEVVNPDLGKYKLAKGFEFVNIGTHPTITAITPRRGDYRGGNIVQIEGSGFAAGIKVYFGTQTAQVYDIDDDGRTLWAYVPAYPDSLQDNNSAIVPVTVQNTDSGSFTKYDGYTYVNPGYTPKITRIEPNTGSTAGGGRVLITGENFRTVTGAVYAGNMVKPEVYFGGVKVPPEDITFVLPSNDTTEGMKTSSLIVVEKTPRNSAGRVDVTVINYDGATATLKNGFEYRSRNPVITQILPNQGGILGGDEITIVGRDFVESGLHVVFGDEKGRQDVLSGQATVTVGDIIVHYDAFSSGDNIKLYYKNYNAQNPEENQLKGYLERQSTKTHSFKLARQDGNAAIFRIPWQDIAEEYGDTTKAAWGDEQIKVELKGTEVPELIVTRRLGIVQRVENAQRVTVKIPPGIAIGRTRLTLYNHDGTNASGDFTYTSPYRSPIITEIIPATDVEVTNVEGIPNLISLAIASPKGGSPLIIKGQNFRAGVRVFIGDKQAEVKSRGLNDDELLITVPAAATDAIGPYLRILVINEDGGRAYGDTVPEGASRRPYYFQYIIEGSNPIISLVNPNKGPTIGGTRVTIKGNEFKNEDSLGAPREVEVFIGGIPIPQVDVTYIDYNTLEVIAPEGKVGPQTIEVVNYDYGRAIGNDMYTYISQPKILSVNPTKLFSNDTETEVTITGRMFLAGAKVVVGGEVIKEEEITGGMEVRGTGIRGVDSEGNNKNVAVIGGIEATSVQVENQETLKVKLPEAFDLKSNDIIVINPDGGVSEPYKDFDYQIPIPTKPLVVEAIPGYESTVQLLWSDSDPEVLNAADKYEVYGKKSTDRSYSFIGDTEGAQFLVKGLEADTRYDFMVRALNRYGSALEFAEVSVRTLNSKEDHHLKDKQEELEKTAEKLRKEGKEEVVDGALVKTIGTEQIPTGNTPYTLDFSLSQYSNHDKFIIAIPVSLLSTLNRRLIITDGRATFSFTPNSLYTREVIQGATGNMEDAHVQVIFEKVSGQEAEGFYSAVPRTQRRASNIYSIDFNLQVGKDITAIRRMLQAGNLAINFDARSYANVDSSKLFIGEYNASKHEFTRIRNTNSASLQEPTKLMLLADR
ncbi:IPT/TIG domain-containing protein [Clostridium formicaceticum]|uniref:IPT/TIG domain protein n=1 Tax=Clostridium formicaceticum TaxID=1497 RepID=A0AAC9WEJ1_9CLOT|nr:IPT/TIG domain-containing protein [Clostridium formicaceticum]AOY75520.1 hypothetical protein BJL90_06185 [Clostridium formicaceticum]ARE85812.1 IPT/TIG domain protein [Clostridium formicaceticum]